jgi:hypothetical protein
MIIRGRSGEVTIRERAESIWFPFWFLVASSLFGPGTFFFIAAVDSHNYSTLTAQLAVLATVLAWIGIRAARMGIRFDARGVTVRNFWRTRRLSWRQVRHLADGEIGGEWALRVVGRDGRAVTASGTRSQVTRETQTVKPETLAAIGEVAERYGVSLELTGRPPSFRLDATAWPSP